MVYDPNIPTANQLISASQSAIQGNFAAIDSSSTGFAVDHVTLTDGTNGGKHKKMTMVQQGSAPSTGASEVDLYTKALGGQPELYLRQQSNGTEVLMTRGTPTSSSGEGVAFGGLQIRCGSGSSNGSGISNNFSSSFSTACVAVVASGRNSAQPTNDIKVTAISASAFTATSASGESIYYIAIGY